MSAKRITKLSLSKVHLNWVWICGSCCTANFQVLIFLVEISIDKDATLLFNQKPGKFAILNISATVQLLNTNQKIIISIYTILKVHLFFLSICSLLQYNYFFLICEILKNPCGKLQKLSPVVSEVSFDSMTCWSLYVTTAKARWAFKFSF